MESILTSIKKLLGISADYTHFDSDLILHINSVFSILTQLGVGPKDGFSIKGSGAKWKDFIDSDATLSFVKSYVFLKVKLLFDPPLGSAVMESYNRLLGELEFRILVAADGAKSET